MNKRKNELKPENEQEEKGIVEDNKKIKKEEIPKVPNKPNQCHFYVKKKKRYCNMTAKRGGDYCGEHVKFQIVNNDNGEEVIKRIPCPYDGNHTVFEKALEKHLKVCNARPPEVFPDYYSKDLHLATDIENDETKKLSEQTESTVKEFLTNLSNKANELVPDVDEEILDHNALFEQRNLKTDVKHVAQQASLIGHLEKAKLLNKNNVFIEFGAGKGELSLYVDKALNDTNPEKNDSNSFVLVDRSNFRLKFDRYLSGEKVKEDKAKNQFQRLMIDIKDLDLNKVEIIKGRPVVAYSKHLCGGATDLTLKCLANFKKAGGKISGIIIALCCHHRCNSSTYTSFDYLKKNEILQSEQHISWLSSITSWATCGKRVNSEHNIEHDDIENEVESNDDNKHFSGLSHQEREFLGFQTKRLLDLGRLDYIVNHLGLKPHLIKYIDKKLSLENIALIALPKSEN